VSGPILQFIGPRTSVCPLKEASSFTSFLHLNRFQQGSYLPKSASLSFPFFGSLVLSRKLPYVLDKSSPTHG